MYSACIFCHRALGANEAVEHFPVGRRLAFDAAKGRLWVVCPHCARWNLTPLEERWEAIEQCERLFASTRTRVATDNIALAERRDGLVLVRVGRPPRQELAAWRYGREFLRRRVRAWLWDAEATVLSPGDRFAAGAIIAVVVTAATPLAGLAAVLAGGGSAVAIGSALNERRAGRIVARIPVPRRSPLEVRRADLAHARLVAATGDGSPWALSVAHRGGEHRLYGADALHAGSILLSRVNVWGASRAELRGALARIEEAGSPERLYAAVGRFRDEDERPFALGALLAEDRLALEMAAHEKQERRALEGELSELERVWREAEEIAAIADDLLTPASVAERLSRLRGSRH